MPLENPPRHGEGDRAKRGGGGRTSERCAKTKAPSVSHLRQGYGGCHLPASGEDQFLLEPRLSGERGHPNPVSPQTFRRRAYL